MGTTTFYLRHNNLGRSLNNMAKDEIEKLSRISPYSKEPYYMGWKVPFELHNGNGFRKIFIKKIQ